MKTRTIRELGGEIWAEIEVAIRNRDAPLGSLPNDAVDALVDLMMSVLARHAGEVIENDKDLPVTPLPSQK